MTTTKSASDVTELLETKLFAPRWREGMISRPRLLNLLAQAVERKLTLISAPAGFGKTTLVAEWIASTDTNGSSVGWVSLDQSDNDPQNFWRYVLAALGKVDPSIGARARRMLDTSGSPQIETVLTSAINDVANYGEDVRLVLDDFHVIEAKPILRAVEFLIQHLPPSMHIIIASRSDPPLPLARLRGRGEAVELRIADLRFTAEETSAFLKDAMGLDLAASDVAALDSRTEGWIAGLQLAALSLRGREDTSEFIHAFAGDDRYVVDYLVDEVLNRQTDAVRAFLLRTSILDRFCGPLCDALDGGEDGQAMLEALERDNVFLAPLDDKRRWYRYHHLFADVLHAHALQEYPDQIRTWHQRASDWYERHQLHSDAIQHALAGGDLNQASELIELAWRPMDRSRRGSTWLTWVSQLPAQQVEARPVLCVAYAWALLEEGELQAGADWLDIADKRLSNAEAITEQEASRQTEMIVSDDEEFEHLPAAIAAARAFHALAVNDVDATVEFARRALELLPEHEHSRRSSPAALLALAAWTRGDLDEAARSLEDSIANARTLGDSRYAIIGSYVLGEILRGQGRLNAAEKVYAQTLQLAPDQAGEMAGSTADINTGLAELHLLRNELDDAERELERSRALAEGAGLPHWRHRWLVARAGLLEARGDLEAALEVLNDAAGCYTRGPVPEIRPIAAYRARILIRSGRLDEADQYVAGLPGSSDATPVYLSEYGQLTLARQIIARRREDSSNRFRAELYELLDRLLDAAISQRRVASRIEILAIKALALDAFGARPRAFAPLKEALELAEPLGLTRVFLAEGAPMRDLLRAVVASGETSGLLQRLWPAFDAGDDTLPTLHESGDSQPIEPLTEREIDVLRLIATGMRNREIADQLYISVSTVKRHIANAYGKLGVHSRTEAAARARDLNLL